ncbi:MAG: hypothetical protein H7263_04280 [Candidatus Sericytochromatia bacterium]|nr:hypothetical protein [Candidatus Sericytochromatia bacterium]
MKKLVKSSSLILFSSLFLFISGNNNLIAAVNPIKNSPKPSTNSLPSPPPTNKSKLKINSDEAKYDRKSKIALATGHVKITQDTSIIFTSSVMYNEGLHTSFIDQFVRIVNTDKETNRKTDISANKMIAYHQEKKVHLEDKVRFDREEERKFILVEPTATDKQKTEVAIRKERTVITSDSVDYWTKSGDAVFTGGAIVLQREKKATGDTITVKNDANKNTDTITLDKNATLTQIKGDWLVNGGIINPKEDKEKQRLVKEKLEMDADNIVIYQKTSDLIGKGNVKITQNVANKSRQATSQQAIYSEISKTMTLTGNVRIKNETEDWITAEKAVFHTDSENFESYAVDPANPLDPNKKQIDSVFTIPDEENPKPELPIGKSGDSFNLDEKNKSDMYTKPEKPAPSNIPAKNNNKNIIMPKSIPSPPKVQPSANIKTKPNIITPSKPSLAPTVINKPINNKPFNSPSPMPTPIQQLLTPPPPSKIPNKGEFSFPNN